MDKLLLIYYPSCTTCQRAEKWLAEQGISCMKRHIKEQNPTAGELDAWAEKSGQPLTKFFNTSGMLYRSLGLKDKLADMTRQEQLEMLASSGMLVKRPLLIGNGGEDFVLIGFRPEKWEIALAGYKY